MTLIGSTVVLLLLATAPPAAGLWTSQKGPANVRSVLAKPYRIENIPGAVAPLGLFDPANLAGPADPLTLKRYREAELVHGRVAMLAAVGFGAGEAVEGSSFLWDASVSGPAITHWTQVPTPFWAALTLLIAYFELERAKYAFVEPQDVPVGQQGLLRAEYIPGDIGFDPLNLRPKRPLEYEAMQNKELQNGRLAMIAAAGFMAQELVDGKGIIEHLTSN